MITTSDVFLAGHYRRTHGTLAITRDAFFMVVCRGVMYCTIYKKRLRLVVPLLLLMPYVIYDMQRLIIVYPIPLCLTF